MTWDGPRPIPVFNYHHVHDDADSSFRVTPLQLAEQFSYLQEEGFQFMRLQQMIEQKGLAQSGKKQVFITFDDGYENFLSHAWPTIQARNIPCTLFLISDYLGDWNDWDDLKVRRYRHLSVPQLQMLSAKGLSLGSHSRTHPILTQLGRRQLWQEVYGSKRVLEKLFGQPIQAFAYPGGHVDQRVRNVTSRHYKLGFATTLDSRTPDWAPYCIPRIDASFCQTIQILQQQLDHYGKASASFVQPGVIGGSGR